MEFRPDFECRDLIANDFRCFWRYLMNHFSDKVHTLQRFAGKGCVVVLKSVFAIF